MNKVRSAVTDCSSGIVEVVALSICICSHVCWLWPGYCVCLCASSAAATVVLYAVVVSLTGLLMADITGFVSHENPGL